MKRIGDQCVSIVCVVSMCLCLSGTAFAIGQQQSSSMAVDPHPAQACFLPTDPAPEEILFLDTRAPSNDAQVVTTAMVLEEGVAYRVTVEGTFCIWGSWAWSSFPLCDADFPPEPGAMYPTPGVDGPVGQDAEFFFSSLFIGGVCGGGFPLPSYYQYNFQVCLDGNCEFESESWHHPSLNLSTFEDYNPDHLYVYWVVGEGHALSARRPDNPTSDNYGQMKITVQMLSPHQEVQGVMDGIGDLPDGAFPANGLRHALTNQFKALFAELDEGDYCGAIEIIDNQIVRKINGIGPPMDVKDWIYAPWREDLYEQTAALRKGLLQLAGGPCPSW